MGIMGCRVRDRVVLIAIITAALYVVGCEPRGSTQQAAVPPQEAHDHAHDHEHAEAEEHAHEAQEEAQQAQKKGPTVEDAKKAIEDESPEKVMQAMGQLIGFLQDPRVADEARRIIMDVLRKHPNASARAAAIEALAVDPTKSMDAIIAAADDPDRIVRNAAIAALGRCPKGSAAEAKLEALVKNPDRGIQTLAKSALTAMRIGGQAGEIVGLVGQLGIAENDASSQAAIALKSTKGVAALPFLETAIKTSPDPRQRHAATMCVALICAGTNPSQAAFAASTKSTKKTTVTAGPSHTAGLPILVAALRDPEPMVREIAAQGLGYLGDERAAAPLAAALKDPDVHVRRRAASALITTPAKSVIRELTEATLRDPDATVRRFAVEALGWIGDPAVVTTLARAAQDPSPDVRRYAATQLGRLKDAAGLDALISLFKDKDEDVRWAAVQAVANMRDRRAVQHLVAALEDPAPQVANAAEAGLQKLGIGRQRVAGLD